MVLTSSKPDTQCPHHPCSGPCLRVQDAPISRWVSVPVPRALPSLAHAGLQPSQLLVGLVENVKVSGTPAPPDSQAPFHVFILKAAHNCVLCYQSCIHQRPGEGRRERGRALQQRALRQRALRGRTALQAQHWLIELPFQLHKLFISCKSFSKENVTKRGIRNCVTSKPSSSVTWEKVFKGIQVPKHAGGGLSLPWHLKLLLIS